MDWKKRIGKWVDKDGRSLPFTQVTELECIAIGEDKVGVRLVLWSKDRKRRETLRFQLPKEIAEEFAQSLLDHARIQRKTEDDPPSTLQ